MVDLKKFQPIADRVVQVVRDHVARATGLLRSRLDTTDALVDDCDKRIEQLERRLAALESEKR